MTERQDSRFKRLPFTLVGAIGLVSLIDNLVNLPSQIGMWADAWQRVTRPVWGFLFGWAFALFSQSIPRFLPDYLTMGVITVGARLRAISYLGENDLNPKVSASPDRTRTRILAFINQKEGWGRLLFMGFIFWPINFLYLLYPMPKEIQKYRVVFFESFIYAAILIGLAYTVIH